MTDAVTRLTEALSGRYDIQRELGSGGMATVYLARDVKHDRDVAVKVLHPDLGAALGASRFLTEIRTTARLQHPHILPLLDSGEAGGLLYYVMPYVTGETLRQRLEREEQLPINAAIAIAKEVADALSAAHEMGIVHRDIKPENILLRGNHALVADFGIALAVQQAGGARMTQTGLSLGTPQYMSPEQAMGEKNIGPRSDIYSLGAVTYEMLAGEPPFTGHSVQAIVAKVMTERPVPLSTIRGTVPPAVESAVHTALAKLPADRFASASEFGAAVGAEAGPTAAIPRARKRTRDPVVIGLGAAVIALATVASLVAMKTVSREPPFPYRMEISPPDVSVLGFADLSPDGSTLAFVGRDSAARGENLYIRRLDQLSTRILAGARRVQGPVFSPDGKWIAYISDRRSLVKVPVDGGTVIPLGDVDDFGGVSWSASGHIVMGAGADEMLGGIQILEADGGSISPLTRVDTADKQLSHQDPIVLDDGKTVVFSIWYGNIDGAQLAAARIGDGRVTKLGLAGTQAIGVVGGQLVFTRSDAMLMAIPFDARKLRVSGSARPVQDFVTMEDPSRGTGNVFLSRSGGLVYLRGASSQRLVWMDHKGVATPVTDERRNYRNVRLSPDGTRAALTMVTGLKTDLWIFDFAAGTLTRVTDDGSTRNPVWSSDGRQLLYVSTKGGRAGFWRASADGSTQPVEIGRSTHNNAWNIDVSPDRRTLVFNAISNRTFNLETWDIDPPHREREISMSSTAGESNGRFSPDGKLIAYNSNESGRSEVYIRSYPENSGKLQISAGGGTRPVWSPGGDRIYYWENKTMMIASLSRDPAPRVMARQALFSGDYVQDYDISPAGDRLLMLESHQEPGQLVVVPHWASELKAKTRQR